MSLSLALRLGLHGMGAGIPRHIVSLWAAKNLGASKRGPAFSQSLAAGVVPNGLGGTNDSALFNYHAGKGLYAGPAYTNKCVCQKYNPTGITGVAVAGGSAVTLVNDSAALETAINAGIFGADLCTSGIVYEITLPTLKLARFTGAIGNTNKHSMGILARVASGALNIAEIGFSGVAGRPKIASNSYTSVTFNNVTPSNSSNEFFVYNPSDNTIVIRCILPNCVESPYGLDIITVSPDAADTASVVSSVSGATYYQGITMNQAMIDAIASTTFTLVHRAVMGASSAETTADSSIVSCKDTATGLVYAASGGKLKTNDGTNVAEVTVTDGWVRNDVLDIIVIGNGANMKIGYRKNGAEITTFGSDATYDGSFNPGTKIKFSYSSDKPQWHVLNNLSNKVLTDDEITGVLEYA